MTDTRNTPAPWSLFVLDDGAFTICTNDGVDRVICSRNAIDYNKNAARESIANARLIAAAPELLDVCEAFIGWIGDGVAGEMLADIRARARAAIEKARKE